MIVHAAGFIDAVRIEGVDHDDGGECLAVALSEDLLRSVRRTAFGVGPATAIVQAIHAEQGFLTIAGPRGLVLVPMSNVAWLWASRSEGA